MPDYGNPNDGGRKGPPPVPVMPSKPKRPITATFRGGIARTSRPPPPPERLPLPRQGRPEGSEPIVSGTPTAPAGARITQSIARPMPKGVATEETKRKEDTLTGIRNDAPKGNTLSPKPALGLGTTGEDAHAAAMKKAAENEERFLRYGSTLYRVSEITGEDWKGWTAEPALMRSKVAQAVEALRGKRLENENYASEYQMIRAFSKEIADDGRLNNYLSWTHAKEKGFSMMAQAYGDMKMTPLTPYGEVMDACERLTSRGVWVEPNEGIILFTQLIANAEEYAGSVYSKGEMYKRMFDSWYLHTTAEAMRGVYDSSVIASERDTVLFRVGELSNEMDELKAANRKLIEEAGKRGIPPAVIEEVHGLRAREITSTAEIGDLQAALRKERETVDAFRAENGRLNEAIGDRNAEIIGLREARNKFERDNAGLAGRISELVAKVDAYERAMKEKDTRMARMENRANALEEEKARLSRELLVLREPEAEHRPTVLSEAPGPVGSTPAASPIIASEPGSMREATAVVSQREMRVIARASEHPEAIAGAEPEGEDGITAVFSRSDVAERAKASEHPAAIAEAETGPLADVEEAEIAAAMDAALGEEAEPPIMVGPAFEKRTVTPLPARPEFSVGTLISDALAAPSVAPPAPILVEPERKEEKPETTTPIDIEREAIPEAREDKFWKTPIGKAVNGIFVYGFAGKGELPSKPRARVIEIPSMSEGQAYARALEERKNEGIRFGMGMAEHNAWYNEAGRWIRAKREGTISGAKRVSEFYSRKRHEVWLVAAGVVGIAGIVTLATVGPHSNMHQRNEEAGMHGQMNKPVAALVSHERTTVRSAVDEGSGRAHPAEQAKVVKTAPKVPAYDLNAAVNTALANSGLSEVNPDVPAGPQLRALYNAALKIENAQDQFAVLAYTANYMLDNNIQLKMDDSMVRNILITAMGTGRNVAMGNPQATAAAVKIATRASGVLNKDGGFSKAKPTKGQEVLYKSVIEWMGTVPASAMEAQEVQEAPAPQQESGAAVAAVAGAQAPQAAAANAPVSVAPFDMSKAAENAFAKNSIPRDGNPRDIYRKAKALENVEERFAILVETADRVYGSKEIQHKMSEAVLGQIIIDAMGSSVEFASMEGQDLGRKKAALDALTRMSDYVGPKGEFNTKTPPSGYDKKVREAREGKLRLAEEVGALEAKAASLRGSPTAAEGNAPVLPPTVSGFSSDGNNEEPAYGTNGVSDWFVEQSYQVNGLNKNDTPRKILDASWKMKSEERFAVLSDLCEKIRKNPGLIPEDQPELRIDILLSAADAGKIVADMPKLFKREGHNSGFVSVGGEFEVLLLSEDYIKMVGKPGQNKKVWTPERVAKRDKLAAEIKEQMDHRGRQIRKAFINSSEKE